MTAAKRWKEVCRALGHDLSGQTSASFAMRCNYERCLLDFEVHLGGERAPAPAPAPAADDGVCMVQVAEEPAPPPPGTSAAPGDAGEPNALHTQGAL